MKCCASQITATALEGRGGVDPAIARRGNDAAVATQFEALLVGYALAPVAKSLGFYGDVVTSAVARAVAGDTNDAVAASLSNGSR